MSEKPKMYQGHRGAIPISSMNDKYLRNAYEKAKRDGRNEVLPDLREALVERGLEPPLPERVEAKRKVVDKARVQPPPEENSLDPGEAVEGDSYEEYEDTDFDEGDEDFDEEEDDDPFDDEDF